MSREWRNVFTGGGDTEPEKDNYVAPISNSYSYAVG